MDFNEYWLPDDFFDDCLSERDFYPPEDKRRYNGIIGSAYDSIYEYREEFFRYVEDV